MSRRARYDGPSTAVEVYLPDGRVVEVERGHLLPTEVEGEAVPAAVRDELLERADWSEVDQSSSKKGA
jgi:hypothetical protein